MRGRQGGPSPCVSDAVGVPSKDEDALATMAGADIGRSNAAPFRIEPEAGQVSENTAKCSENRLAVCVSHRSRLGFQVASRCGAG